MDDNKTTLVELNALKQSQEELKLEKMNLEAIFESSPVGMLIIDESTNIIMANEAIVALAGVEETEILQHRPGNALRCIHSSKDPRGCGYSKDCKLCELRNGVELLIKDGGFIRGAELAVNLMRDEKEVKVWLKVGVEPLMINNLQHWCVALDNITESKQITENYKKSQELLSETGKIGKVGGWEFNIDTFEQNWTEETYHIHEIDIHDKLTVEKGINYYTTESKPIIDEAVKRAIEFGEPFDLDLEIITAKGNLRSVNAIGKADLTNRRIYGFFQDITERKLMLDVQEFMLKCGHPGSGEEFFESLAKYLSTILNMEYVCIDQLEGDGLTAKTLAIYNDGIYETNVSYALKETPCGDVVGKTICCFPENVCNLFPLDQALLDLKAISYIGTTLWSFDGKPIGLIAIIGQKPLKNATLAELVLKHVAVRAAGELERLKAEVAILETNQLLSLFVKQSPIYTYVKDVSHDESRVLIASENMKDLTGIAGSDMIGKNMYELFPSEFGKKITQDDWKVISDGEIIQLDEELNNRYYTTIKFPISFGNKKKLAGYTIDITDRKNAEAELRKSQELLKATSEMASVGGWEIDLEKQTLTWSDEVFKIHETDENFIPTVEKAIDFYAPESIPLITEAVNRAIEKGEAFDLQLQIITAKGVRKWVHAKGNAVLANGKAVKITGTFQDIHQRKLIEEQLKQKTDEIETQNEEIHQQNEEYRQLNEELFRSDERYRSLITHLEAGVVVHSADTSIINNNQRASFLLGLNEEQIKGKLAIDPRWKFININNLPLSLEEYPVNRIISSQKPFKDFILGVCRPENNDVIWLTVNGFPVFNKLQQLTEVVISFIDITDRKLNEIKLKEKSEEIETQNEEYKQINEEYKQINEELYTAKLRAEGSDKLKSAFLANMSHEIRTPMNGIVGFADLLNSPNITNEKRKDFTAIIIERSNHLLSIVNDILDISKIEAGMVTVKNENVPINILLLELYTYYSNHDKLRDIKLEVKYGIEDTKTRIYIDDTKMMQIFNNLISNALKFTSKGHIVFGYELKGKMLQFFVEDTGIGIPDDFKEKVFDRFIQVEMEFSKSYGGTGLGLSITKELVHLMGGDIWLESTLGVGTKVFFTMPYNIAKSEEQLLLENPDLLNKKNIAGKSILIVDDDETNLYYLNEITTNLELKIYKATNGFEAIEQFKNNSDISLILMDIKMPVMGGMEATKLIKSINGNVKVIAQTAHALLTEQDLVITGGCDDYISKPLNRENLISLIRKYI